MPTKTAVPSEIAAALARPSASAMASLAERIPGFAGIEITEAGTFLLGYRAVSEPIPSPLVPVTQLFAADIPDLHCPAARDMVQVLWCPNEHVGADFPDAALQLRWRTASAVSDPLDAPSPPAVARADHYLPQPCVLHPEQVVEYPWWQDLPSEIGRRIRDFDDQCEFGEDSYFSVSQAPGWKVGGYASWEISDLLPMRCPGCDQQMELLLTIDPTESRGAAWRPVEESHLQPIAYGPAVDGSLRAHRRFRGPPRATANLRLSGLSRRTD